MKPTFKTPIAMSSALVVLAGNFIMPNPALAENMSSTKVQASATVRIISPLITTQHRLLRFGEFECDDDDNDKKGRAHSCSLTLSPLGALTHTGDIDDIDGRFKSAVFAIQGSANQSYQLTLPDSLSSGSLTVTDFRAFSRNGNRTTTYGMLNSDGQEKIYVGATLIIPAGFEQEHSLKLDIPFTISY